MEPLNADLSADLNPDLAGQYLSFMLDEETFALHITKVREVLEFAGVTRIPRTPDFMRGVINLRGSVVPVVDLKQRFGVGATEQTTDTCVVIVEMIYDGESAIIGLLADSVQEVFDLAGEEVQPPPSVGSWVSTDFVLGMGRLSDRFLMLLDIDRVFDAEEVEAIAGAGRLPT